jgi:uncharacterized membrane protein
MYTFAPIPPVVVTHEGFFVATFLLTLVFIIVWLNNDYEEINMWRLFSVFGAIVAFVFYMSYHFFDQTTKYYANTKVVGEFAGYVAEGYNEARRSGKTTTRVDVHELYVIYKVDGNPILLSAKPGFEYPQRAVLYKN